MSGIHRDGCRECGLSIYKSQAKDDTDELRRLSAGSVHSVAPPERPDPVVMIPIHTGKEDPHFHSSYVKAFQPWNAPVPSATPRTDAFSSLQRTHREWIEHSSAIERELAATIRERDNALSDWRQADTDSIRAIHERNEARAQRDEWLSVVALKTKQLGDASESFAVILREIILADSLNDARTIAREALANIKP